MPIAPPGIVRHVRVRRSVLVIAVALTMSSSVPEIPLGHAGLALLIDQSAAPVGLDLSAAAARDDDLILAATTRSDALMSERVAPASASGATGCPAGGSVHGHRDDVAAHPERSSPLGCRVAGPKRIHGSDRRTDAVAAPSSPGPEAAAAAPAPAATTRWSGGFNLYRETAFVTQKDFRWCVAASVQMMVNLVRHRTDRSAATQRRMIQYAQASDHGPWGPGGGTDVTGWIAALRHFGAGKYRAVGTRSPDAALRMAATAMRQTGRPAGMLVMDGRHAWVLHGFESRNDPRKDRRAKITSVRVSGPLYPIQQKHGYDLHPNTELTVRALARYFEPSDVGALAGRYVVIVPVH